MTDSVARGWHPDPARPGRERWWTGDSWAGLSHRAASEKYPVPANFQRAFWAGANRWAFLSEIPLSAGLLAVFAMMALSGIDPVNFNTNPVAAPLAIAAAVLAAISALLAIMGLVVSPRQGAVGLSACSLVGSASLLFLAGFMYWAGTVVADSYLPF